MLEIVSSVYVFSTFSEEGSEGEGTAGEATGGGAEE